MYMYMYIYIYIYIYIYNIKCTSRNTLVGQYIDLQHVFHEFLKFYFDHIF